MNLRDLLFLNLGLQLFDGLVSYQAFSVGAGEANALVAAAIINWGVIWGLLYVQHGRRNCEADLLGSFQIDH